MELFTGSCNIFVIFNHAIPFSGKGEVEKIEVNGVEPSSTMNPKPRQLLTTNYRGM